jgi:hypothetical protein
MGVGASTNGTVGIRFFLTDNAATDLADPALKRLLATAAEHSCRSMSTARGRLGHIRAVPKGAR